MKDRGHPCLKQVYIVSSQHFPEAPGNRTTSDQVNDALADLPEVWVTPSIWSLCVLHRARDILNDSQMLHSTLLAVMKFQFLRAARIH